MCCFKSSIQSLPSSTRWAPTRGVKGCPWQLQRGKAQFHTHVLGFLMPLDASICSLTKPGVFRLVLRLRTKHHYVLCPWAPSCLTGKWSVWSSFIQRGWDLPIGGFQLWGWTSSPVLVVPKSASSRTLLKGDGICCVTAAPYRDTAAQGLVWALCRNRHTGSTHSSDKLRIQLSTALPQ